MISNINTLPKCPITQEIMFDPVSTPDGNTYERTAIIEWLNKHNTEPLTRKPLNISQLIPNRALKELYNQINNTIIINNTTTDINNTTTDINNTTTDINNTTTDINNTTTDINNLSTDINNLTTDINNNNLSLDLTCLKKNNNTYDLLFTINSPESDEEDEHNIILCLDNSGSMGLSANKMNEEKSGLTVLDILKHGVKTIINTCNNKHKIAIVSFSNQAKIRCPLTVANAEGKARLLQELELIVPDGMTNLYDGIIKSWLLVDPKSNIKSSVIIFTDGEPNMDPPRGILNTLKGLKEKNNGMYNCDINIFTYGNNVNSELSDNISRETNGVYGYMPDASFIGDLLEHKIASIRSSRLKNSELKIDFKDITNITVSSSINFYKLGDNIININVGDILYGQNRNFVITITNDDIDNTNFESKINDIYQCLQSNNIIITDINHISIIDNQNIEKVNKIYYNEIRQNTVTLLTNIINECNNKKFIEAEKLYTEFMNTHMNTHMNTPMNTSMNTHMNTFVSNSQYLDDLKKDLDVQIKLAITEQYYKSWGKHYLLSIKSAYQLEQCNNFKDAGVQHFCSKLFTKILDEADDIFIQMPPPKRSNNPLQVNVPIDMSTFSNRYSSVCFHELSHVLMANNSIKYASNVTKGDVVQLGNGEIGIIECILQTIYIYDYDKPPLIKINNDLSITPYHPIKINNEWIFPINMFESSNNIEYTTLYNFILDTKSRKKLAGIIIGGVECATLGHGIKNTDIISHPFFGTNNIIDNLKKSKTYDLGWVIITSENIIRDPTTNLVNQIIIN